MRPLRLSVKQLMIVVALAGSLLGLGGYFRLRQLSEEYLARAEELRHQRETPHGFGIDLPPPGGYAAAQEALRAKQGAALKTWSRQMEQKYRDAAARPWLPVAPDPPMP